MAMTKAYQEHGRKCRELAEEAQSPEDRTLLLKIADTWNWIADDGEIPLAGKGSNHKHKSAK